MRQGSAVWAVTVMVVAGTAGIVALAAVGNDQSATLLPLLIGFLAPTVTGLMAANKASENSAQLRQIDGRLNGELDKRIGDAVTAALHQYHAAKEGDCIGEGCA